MNYASHYQRLMDRAPKVKPKTGYFERHRILPGCMGGKYTKGNIAYLTPEEHYIAHLLLAKMYPHDSGLVWASLAIASRNSKSFGIARRLHSKKMKELWADPVKSVMVREKQAKSKERNRRKLRLKLRQKGQEKETLELLKRKSLETKIRWEDPEFKSKQLAARKLRIASCVECRQIKQAHLITRYHGDRCRFSRI